MIEATISQAKRILKECVEMYLEKNEAGLYCCPQNKQRPVYLEGPAGIGKTELVKQVAEEMGIGFVSYSMTHHNRQSAIGLPAIVEKEQGDQCYKATEYTMSEIVSSVWDAKQKGAKEGILFADEVNCVSETLTAAMLQFLQNKTFGPHQIPEGWIIMAAGNPPEYNKSVKVFDAVTLDRMRILHLKPDREDWIAYAAERGMHPIVMQYVREHAAEFYNVKTFKGKAEIVTARGWEDLSNAIKAHERLGFLVDEVLVAEFIQNDQTAWSFFSYYKTVNSLISPEEIQQILNGEMDDSTQKKLRAFEFQKRWAVMMCLYAALQSGIEALLGRLQAHEARYQELQNSECGDQAKKSFQEATAVLDEALQREKIRIDHVLTVLGHSFDDGKEAEILINMMLDNQYFHKLSGYCRLDSMIALYEARKKRRNSAKREISAWIRKGSE